MQLEIWGLWISCAEHVHLVILQVVLYSSNTHISIFWFIQVNSMALGRVKTFRLHWMENCISTLKYWSLTLIYLMASQIRYCLHYWYICCFSIGRR